MAANAKNPPAATVPLYEYIEKGSGRRAYSTEKSLDLAGFERQEKPLCRVWRNPWQLTPPLSHWYLHIFENDVTSGDAMDCPPAAGPATATTFSDIGTLSHACGD